MIGGLGVAAREAEGAGDQHGADHRRRRAPAAAGPRASTQRARHDDIGDVVDDVVEPGAIDPRRCAIDVGSRASAPSVASMNVAATSQNSDVRASPSIAATSASQPQPTPLAV